MSYRMREVPAFTVMGIGARASNAAPEGIGELWRRFHAMGSAQAVEGRLDDTVYSVYCEYDGDWTQPYTVLIGCAVDDGKPVSEGMRTIKIGEGRFAVLPVMGDLPQGVFDVWREVWDAPLDRRYEADFDRYGANGSVTVHVGVR